MTDFTPASEKDFEDALKLCLQYEGGYCNDPHDRGGETCYGITHTEYDNYRHSKGLPQQSVGRISQSEVQDIYRNRYWLAARCDEMPRRVAIAVFDWQVNSGRGVRHLQQCLGLEADGHFGPKTLNELNYWLSKSTGEDRLLHNYFEIREGCYRRWGVGSQAKFLNGWLNRAESLKKYLKVA